MTLRFSTLDFQDFCDFCERYQNYEREVGMGIFGGWLFPMGFVAVGMPWWMAVFPMGFGGWWLPCLVCFISFFNTKHIPRAKMRGVEHFSRKVS